MDTKLRSYSHSKLAKMLAFILVIASFTSMVLMSLIVVDDIDQGLLDSVLKDNYYSSNDYLREVRSATSDVISLVVEYKSEEHIMSGALIDKEELERLKEELFNELTGDSNDYHNTELRNKFETEHKEEIEELKNKLIKEDLDCFRNTLYRLEQKEHLVYYVRQGETVFSNIEKNSIDDFKDYPAYVILKGNESELYPKESEEAIGHINWNHSNTGYGLSQADQVQIAFTQDYMDQKLSAWRYSRRIIKNTTDKLIILFMVLILSLTYLFVVTGRGKSKDNKIDMSQTDKLYTDINIILMISVVTTWLLIISNIFNKNMSQLGFAMIATISAIACSVVFVLLLSLVRHIKNKSLFSHSLTITLVRKVHSLGKDIYDSGSVATKVAIAVIVYPLLAAVSVFFFPITIGFAVWLAHRKVKEYMKIKDGVEKIKNGEIDHKINIDRNGEFKSLAEGINTIGEGFNHAIANELKSERLKTELITNVSHDIRTPLTSIITYIDLIKNEKDKTKINEYIRVIEQKSNRLKILTDDLFEASKATSGNIPVSLERIDIVSLITQGLGELDSQVKESELDFKINNFAEKIYVNADGRLLWRAMENLFTNIFKYSLKGSRVYVDIVDLEEKIELSIKNISAYELNISSDELLERFKRGDESRGSEGSGLGLSISKSLIEAQDGEFEILIDGDLFKVVITFLIKSSK